jgi:hypothetical protein
MKAKLFGGVAVSALLCVAACGDDDGATGGAGGATTATTNTAGPTTTTTGPTTTATSSTTAMSSSSTGMMGVCPDDPNDPPCVVCAKETCCDQTDPCLDDPECSTCLDCVANSMDPTECLLGGMCDLGDPETAAAYDCTAGTCTDECYNGGFSCDPDAMGSPCIECAKASCCNQAQACFESALCAQCIQCAQSAANPLECVDSGDCDLGDAATSMLLNCVQTNCDVCLGN